MPEKEESKQPEAKDYISHDSAILQGAVQLMKEASADITLLVKIGDHPGAEHFTLIPGHPMRSVRNEFGIIEQLRQLLQLLA
jgi:hypothetical protein